MERIESNQQENNASKKDQTVSGKTGIVPNKELSGSDADKAYDENGDFGKGADDGSQQDGADADDN